MKNSNIISSIATLLFTSMMCAGVWFALPCLNELTMLVSLLQIIVTYEVASEMKQVLTNKNK